MDRNFIEKPQFRFVISLIATVITALLITIADKMNYLISLTYGAPHTSRTRQKNVESSYKKREFTLKTSKTCQQLPKKTFVAFQLLSR